MKKKLNGRKGFTLAELLVVVAIIAVLAAIAIPVFSAAEEKAAEAADLANVRSAYAELCVKFLQGEITEFSGNRGEDNVIVVPATQTEEKWQSVKNESGEDSDYASISTTFTGGSTDEVSVPYKIKSSNGEYSVAISEEGVVTVS